MTTLLIVDDEPQIRKALRINLEARDYATAEAGDGKSALRMAADLSPDLILLDLGLPDLDGIDVVTALRGWTKVPIIVLTVRDDERSKVAALDAGADDYVTKPFGINELLARIRAALRRRVDGELEPPVTTTDAFVVDLSAHTVVLGSGVSVHLTPIEWGLVEQLVRYPGRLVTQRHLMEAVWGPAYPIDGSLLRVHMNHVRAKLEPDPPRPRYFITEPGMGYRFVDRPGLVAIPDGEPS